MASPKVYVDEKVRMHEFHADTSLHYYTATESVVMYGYHTKVENAFEDCKSTMDASREKALKAHLTSGRDDKALRGNGGDGQG